MGVYNLVIKTTPINNNKRTTNNGVFAQTLRKFCNVFRSDWFIAILIQARSAFTRLSAGRIPSSHASKTCRHASSMPPLTAFSEEEEMMRETGERVWLVVHVIQCIMS